ncbi:MAG: hypothetical protein GJ677_02515 [Rhodobacteraceae bacterium]|nr:hypothetical protein [Paracoccaceae bacterium]
MLSFVVISRGEWSDLRRSLARLAGAVRPEEKVFVVTCGASEDTLRELERHPYVQTLRFDVPELSRAEVMHLMRSEVQTPYMLCLDGQEMIVPEALPALRLLLRSQSPEVVVLNRKWWLGSTDVTLPAPDHRRLMALEATPPRQDLLGLTPDPGRLLLHVDLAKRLAEEAMTTGEWDRDMAAWNRILEASEHVLLCPEPVLLAPLATRAAAPAVQAAAHVAPPDTALLWAGDALAFAEPGEAHALLEAAEVLLAGFATDSALPDLGPMAPVLRGLRSGGPAMGLAELALVFAAQDRARTEALTQAVGTLRSDLDLALPGPDYLRRLYDRIRA